jgi:hypothetical protein
VSTSVVYALLVLRACVASSLIVTLGLVGDGGDGGAEVVAENSLVLWQSKTQVLHVGVHAESKSFGFYEWVPIGARQTSWPTI